jgi:hypothetical protein
MENKFYISIETDSKVLLASMLDEDLAKTKIRNIDAITEMLAMAKDLTGYDPKVVHISSFPNGKFLVGKKIPVVDGHDWQKELEDISVTKSLQTKKLFRAVFHGGLSGGYEYVVDTIYPPNTDTRYYTYLGVVTEEDVQTITRLGLLDKGPFQD